MFDALINCRKIGDAAERLACFDKAADQLAAAQTAGDVVVVDRQEIKKAQRSTFGFNVALPQVFKDKGGKAEAKEEKGQKTDEAGDIEAITAVATKVWQGARGEWNFQLEDGAVWRQTDAPDPARSFKNGVTVEIKKGKLGNFFLKANGALMRAKRDS
ncbi:hypothetical protein P7B02_17735 [Caulobacter segnis]|uniref:hypothetical protein n=1 Tax=Caulobacter segnis TaxID=88688 RepID=UPI00240EF419|nr:hypothetical protein [Caulobacter segnis]MDG2523373.1 hypothetical protein [Caulobacter segnis]